jgi:hypothetical protein
MDVSVAIAVKDEADLASGHRRKKEGDIIAIKPAGWQWGSGEVKNHLILELSFPEAKTMDDVIHLMAPYYTDGKPEGEITVAKRRFKVDINNLKTEVSTKTAVNVDWKKVSDDKMAYQPLSVQSVAVGGQEVKLDPYAMVHDKYADKIITKDDIAINVIK